MYMLYHITLIMRGKSIDYSFRLLVLIKLCDDHHYATQLNKPFYLLLSPEILFCFVIEVIKVSQRKRNALWKTDFCLKLNA